MEKGLVGFFESYLEKQPLFRDKSVLQSNFYPSIIPHRESQIKTLAGILAPILNYDKPSNVFIYGKTGTGKTLSVKHIINNLNEVVSNRSLRIKICYVNCKLKRVADTEYRLLVQILKDFGKTIPPTGLPTDELYSYFYNTLE